MRERERETGIAADSVVECVVEFLRFAKCLVRGALVSYFWVAGPAPGSLSVCSLSLKATATSQCLLDTNAGTHERHACTRLLLGFTAFCRLSGIIVCRMTLRRVSSPLSNKSSDLWLLWLKCDDSVRQL